MSDYLQSDAYREAKGELFRSEMALTGWSMATTALAMGAFFAATTLSGPLGIGLAVAAGVGALGCGVKSYFSKVDAESMRHQLNSGISASHLRAAIKDDGLTNQEKRILAVQQMTEGLENKPRKEDWAHTVTEVATHAAAHKFM